MIGFLSLTRQWEKAEKAAHDAELALKASPVGPGRCCEVLGQAYKNSGRDAKKSQVWLDEAGRWFAKAHNDQQENLNLFRQYIDFLIRRASLSGNVDDRKAAHDQINRYLVYTKNSTDPEVLQRPYYILQLVDVLFRLYQSRTPGRELLNETQDLLREVKAFRPDAVEVLVFEARLLKGGESDRQGCRACPDGRQAAHYG